MTEPNPRGSDRDPEPNRIELSPSLGVAKVELTGREVRARSADEQQIISAWTNDLSRAAGGRADDRREAVRVIQRRVGWSDLFGRANLLR